eukprot:GHVP01066007.1.p1 GENE.GHVP01066007.1~~GHVP01066007.1.p1  ORF type:complete len:211 (+),score=9.92 GHVP01066007.1:874-1506(+)
MLDLNTLIEHNKNSRSVVVILRHMGSSFVDIYDDNKTPHVSEIHRRHTGGNTDTQTGHSDSAVYLGSLPSREREEQKRREVVQVEKTALKSMVGLIDFTHKEICKHSLNGMLRIYMEKTHTKIRRALMSVIKEILAREDGNLSHNRKLLVENRLHREMGYPDAGDCSDRLPGQLTREHPQDTQGLRLHKQHTRQTPRLHYLPTVSFRLNK